MSGLMNKGKGQISDLEYKHKDIFQNIMQKDKETEER